MEDRKMDEGWKKLANEHPDCRAFIEFADEHKTMFNDWLVNRLNKTLQEAERERNKGI